MTPRRLVVRVLGDVLEVTAFTVAWMGFMALAIWALWGVGSLVAGIPGWNVSGGVSSALMFWAGRSAVNSLAARNEKRAARETTAP